jgi:uncharacterized protein GlcG (DUF336 family)
MNTVRMRRVIDDAGADAVLEAALAKANGDGSRVVVAVVDPGGEVIELRRSPGAQIASSRVAVDKARTAAIFVRPSRELEEQVTSGRLGALALHGASALTGGVPLVVDGEVVGAVGTSGETPAEDEAISYAGSAAALSTDEVAELTYEGARRAAEAVAAEATSRGVAPVAAVVDSGGELVYLWRPDRAQVASVAVAIDKARTAAIYRRPSKDFEDQASNGRPSALHLSRAVPLQGGIPIVHEGHVVGAIGVSGASSADEDQALALLGAAAVAIDDDPAYFPEAFSTGGLLLDAPRYKIDAGRRIAPGDEELHERETDVIYAVEGNACVIAGERAYELRSGDALTIPAGVPHQFVEVSEPFLYFVVKVVG